MQRCLALYTAEHVKMNPEFYSMLERAFHSKTLRQRLWACPARTCGPARQLGWNGSFSFRETLSGHLWVSLAQGGSSVACIPYLFSPVPRILLQTGLTVRATLASTC